jgi:hypothetical protein
MRMSRSAGTRARVDPVQGGSGYALKVAFGLRLTARSGGRADVDSAGKPRGYLHYHSGVRRLAVANVGMWQ